MGVQGLWDLLAPVGRRVSVETLAGKKLAIDASIWMVQFLKAMRDEKGEMVRNAHILGFFRRICKLLFLRTKPVFVFDGGTPALKRRTTAARRRNRENARAKIRKTAEKLLINHLKARKLEELAEEMRRIKEKTDAKGKGILVEEAGDSAVKDREQKDGIGFGSGDNQERLDEMLAASLAMEEEGNLMGDEASSGAGAFEEVDDQNDEELMFPVIHGNVDPSVLASLPPSIQLDLLVQMRERLMAENRQKYQKLKKVPKKFSELQIQSYLKTVAFRREINEVQKVAAGKGLGGVQASKIASEANREFIFSSSFTGNKQMLTSLTTAQENRDMEPSTSVKGLLLSEKGDNSSVGQEKNVPQTSSEVPVTVFGNDIETYHDERGRFRLSRIRALGIRMTRDLERNLELMKEYEKDHCTASIDLEPSNAGGDSTSISVGDALLAQLPSTAENDSVMEICFLDDGNDDRGDIRDEFFSHLAAGTSDFNFNFEKTSSGKSPKDSDSDDIWEEGIKIKEGNVAAIGNSHSNIQLSSDEEDVDWEGGDLHSTNTISHQTAQKNITLSKGLLEEEAEIQEAIKRSLEDSWQGSSVEVINQGLVIVNDDETALPQKKDHVDLHQLNHKTVDHVLHVDTAIKEDPQNLDFVNNLHTQVVGVNCNRDSFESRDSSFDSVKFQLSEPKEGIPDFPGIKDFNEISLDITQQGQNYRNQHVDSADVCSPDYGYKTNKLQSASYFDDQKKSELFHSNNQLDVKSQNNLDGEPFMEIMPNIKGQNSNLMAEDVCQKTQNKDTTYDDKMMESQQSLNAATNSSETEADKSQFSLDRVTYSDTLKNTSHSNGVRMAPPSVSHVEEIQLQPSLDEEMHHLRQERKTLGDEQKRHEINAESVSSEMFAECQELLQMFGLPYIIAPMEAEAQCAHMEMINLVDGVVTDDSDVFLFGARSVYKNIFDDRKYVETYFMKDIENELGLNREKLIRMALLLGSDYTEGVSGIGIVNAIEVLHAFPEEDGLNKFREWLESPDPDILEKIDPHIGGNSKKRLSKVTKNEDKLNKLESNDKNSDEAEEQIEGDPSEAKKIFMSKHRNVSKNWHIPSSFPSRSVMSAYSTPQVDESTEPFSWGKPDLLLLRKLCWERFGWSNPKADELLLPVLKEYNKHETQLRLEAFYSFNERFAKIRSQRIKKAVKGITGRLSSGLLGEPVLDDSNPQEKARHQLESISVGDQVEAEVTDLNHYKGLEKMDTETSKKNRAERSGRRGRGRGRGSDGRKMTGDDPSAKASGRARPKVKTPELSSSDNEKDIGQNQDKELHDTPKMRRSTRQRKTARYAEESSENDELAGLAETPEQVVAGQATKVEAPATDSSNAGMVTALSGPSEKSFGQSADEMTNGYLFCGGGFCLDEDGGTSTAGGPSELSSSFGKTVGSDTDLALEMEDLSKSQSAQLEATGVASNIDVMSSGLRAMPMLRRKRRKMA